MQNLWIRCLFVMASLTIVCNGAHAVEPKMAQGYYYSLYLSADGQVWAVGRNNYGQLGVGDNTNRTEWTKVDLSGVNGVVVDIVCGQEFSMALTTTGDVYAWGRNNYGQCGADPDVDSSFNTPQFVLDQTRAIDAGHYHAGAIRVWGSVYLWGINNLGQLGRDPATTPETYVPSYETNRCQQISLGRYHTMMLKVDGTLWGVGYNYNGELGRGFTSSSPNYIYTSGQAVGLPAIKKVAAGAYSNIAIADDGNCWVWGSNTNGELGMAAGGAEPTPLYISGGYGAVRDVSAGYYHTMVLRVTGQVYMSGANNNGQIGIGIEDGLDVESPTFVMSGCKSLPRSMFLGAGVIEGDGSVKSWGYNGYRAIGNESLESVVYAPTHVEPEWPVEDLTTIAVGYGHSMGLKADGTVWTWGDNINGSLGNNNAPTDALTAVQAYSASNIVDTIMIGSGSHSQSSIIGKTEGKLYGFGANDYGELDYVVIGDQPQPVDLSYHHPLSFASGQQHTALALWNGVLYTTGRNNSAQLGELYPGTANRTSFDAVSVPGTSTSSRAKQVSAGLGHTLALMCDGKVLAWGENNNKQCGVAGNPNPVQTPQYVQRDTNNDGVADGDLTDVIMVAAGSWHSFALTVNGEIWAWGANYQGRTGLGTSSGQTPYAVKITGGPTYYKYIAGGVYHGAAIDEIGDVYTWGYDISGQLGNGSGSADVLVPTNVSVGKAFERKAINVDCANHTLVLSGDGSVYGAGNNGSGRLGDNSTASRTDFVQALPTWYPEINMSVVGSKAYETGALATFRLTRSLSVPGVLETSGVLDVNFNPNQGVAKVGVDINALPTTERIEAGSTITDFSISAINDAIDEDNESIVVDVLSGDRYRIGSSSPSASGNVIDDDTAQISLVLDSAPTTTEGGGTAVYRMRLLTEPTSNVTVRLQTSDTSEGLLDYVNTQMDFVFTPSNWATQQTVYMDGINDFVVDGDINYYLQHVSTSGDPKYAGLPLMTSELITNEDNDVASVVVSKVNIETDEDGASEIINISLTSQPTANVVFPILSNNESEATVSASSVVLNSSNWSAGVNFTVNGEDDDIDDGTVPYAIKINSDTTTADLNYRFLDPDDVSGLNYDNDTAGISVGSVSNDTEEDGTPQATFNVVLDTEPLSNVTIGLSSSDTDEVTLSTSSLTFTPANWDTPQVVTLTGQDDFKDDGDQTVTITTNPATGDATYTGINPADVTVDNLDDDTKGITFAGHTGLQVTEGGATDSYTVRLDSEPIGGNVTVTISPASGLLTDKSSLLFTTGNWNIPQTVTVSADNDLIDEASPELDVTINHSSSGADYAGVSDTVEVDIIDNDTASLVYSANPISVAEGGAGTNYSVSLATEPTDNVTVTVNADSQVRVDGAASTILNFTPANWSTPQVVSATAVDDAVIESPTHAGGISYTVTSPTDSFYNGLSAPAFTVNVTDNDTAGIVVTPTDLTTTEAGGTDQFNIKLTSMPSASVSIPVSSSNTDEGTIAGSSVTILPAQWNTGVNVTVTGVNDLVDDGDVSYTITTGDPTSADGDYDALNAGNVDDVSVTNTDNDSAGVTITESGGSTDVEEELTTTDTYDVVLDTEPSSDVVITVSALSNVTVDKPTLTFTPLNWMNAQTVTVTAIDDNDIEAATHSGVIAHGAAGSPGSNEYDGVVIANVSVNIDDNDAAGAVVTESSETTSESGGQDTFTIRLTAKPTDDVTISLTSLDTGEGTVSPASVTFNQFNWNVDQTVTVTGVDDDIIDIGTTYTIQTGAMSSVSDTNFNGVAVADVTVTNTDNEGPAEIIVLETDGGTAVAEDGTATDEDTFTVQLSSEPSSDVTVTFSHADSEIDIDVVARSSFDATEALTFTSANWDTPQTIVVRPDNDDGGDGNGEDSDTEGPHTGNITVLTSSGDGNFNGIADMNINGSANETQLAVSISDDDQPGILIVESGGDTTVQEDVPVADGDTIYVRLLNAPSGSVDVTFSHAKLIFSPSTLTFDTGANPWATPQEVKITGAPDSSSGETVSVTFTCDETPNGAYDGINDSINVTIIDADVAGISFITSNGTSLSEVGPSSVDYSVVLDSPPGGDVTVTISTPDGQTTADETSITFPAADWYKPIEITATAVNDLIDETNGHTGTIVHTPSGYNGDTPENLNFSITDNDSRGVTVTAISGSVDEATPGVAATYTIVLDTEPTADVTVSLAGTQVELDDSAILDGKASTLDLTFTTSNWMNPQTVYVCALDDNIDEGTDGVVQHFGNITHTVSNGDYDGFIVSPKSVTIEDDDEASVNFDATQAALGVDESGSPTRTFSVYLETEPTATVSINVSSSDTGEVTASPSVLTFLPGNYNTPQLITLTGVDDSIVDGPQTATITLASPSSADTYYSGLTSKTANIDNADNDSIAYVIAETSGDTVVLEEGETSDTFSVRLASRPIGGIDVDVTVAHAGGQIDVEGGTNTVLTYTSANWNVPQNVTITANDDAAIESNPHTATITLTAANDDYDGFVDTFDVDVQDNEQASMTVTPSSGLSVAESGTTTTFDVVLDSAPASDVTVSVVSSDTGEATVDQSTLTFTAGNYNVAQTVTITGVDDSVDDGDVTFDIDLTASGGGGLYDGVTGTASVTCTDDDTVGMTVTPLSGLTTTESGNVAVFLVYLNAEPNNDVVLDVSSSDGGEGDPDKSTLTFDNTNWQTPQVVTVAGDDDDLDDGDIPYSVNVVVNAGLTLDNTFDGIASASVQLTNVDDDAAGIQFDNSMSAITEGANDTYDIRLTSQPTADVTVDLSTELGEVSVSPSSLTFTSANWDDYQTITVTAIDDDIEEIIKPHTDSIIHNTSGGGYDGVNISNVGVTITDDDDADIIVTGSSLIVSEDGSTTDSFNVKLKSEPTATVIVNISVDDATEATVTPSLITFSPSAAESTTGHWDFDQTITVTGTDDDVVDGNISYNISIETVSGDTLYNSLTASVSSRTDDDDSAGITVSPTSLSVSETGTSATYGVVLLSEPTNDVSINVSSGDTDEATVDTSVLIFNNTNWDSPQFVKVTGVDDLVDDGAQSVTITNADATSSDGLYDNVAVTNVDVTVDDDDTAAVVITVSGGLTSVSEAGLTDTYEVSLATEPEDGNDIIINISGDAQISPSVSSLTFDDTNWSTPQTVTISAIDDALYEGSHAGTITHSSSSHEYSGVTIDSVSASIDDNDVVDIIVTPTDGLLTAEDGSTATFTVELTSEPTDDVTIAVSSSDTAEGTVSPSTLTFTAANWDTQQTVTVTGIDEAVDDGDQDYTIILADAVSSDTDYNGFDVADVSVTNVDDDGAGVTLSKTSLTLSESGASDSYTVVLDSSPSSDVTITLSADLDNVNLSSTTLTFTTANYATPQTVIVSADNDAIAEGFHQIAISHSASGDVYTGISIDDVDANITDNDTAGVTVTPTSGLSTNEAGSTDTFSVVLDSEPTSSVTIAVTSLDTTEATVAPASLTFTPGNWNTPQIVTVTGADDLAADGNILYTVELDEAVSDDEFYGGATPIDPDDVTGTNADDEIAGITVSPTSGLTSTESGGSSVFTVRLNTQPTDDVVITLASDTPTEGTASPASLTFTNANWDTTQTVTITGVDDEVDDDDQAYVIVLNPATSSDGNYNGLDATDVSVTNVDDDDVGFTVTPTSGLITSEGGLQANFTVVLTSEPSADVTIDLTSQDTNEGTVSPASLTFTAANWATAQTVTVTGVDDGSQDGDQIYSIVTDPASSADADYNGLDPDDVSVTNQDDDSAAVNIVQSGGATTISESGATSDTFTLVLTTLPTSQVDIAIDYGAGAQVNVSPSSISFTTANYNVPQTITVTAIDDPVAEGAHDQAISFTLTSGDSDYNGLSVTDVTASITDNDTAAITVTPNTDLVTTESGGIDSFTVVLDTRPTNDVTIPVSSGDVTEGTVSVSSLTFNSGNWDTPQTVVVTGIDDAIDDGPVSYTVTLGLPTTADTLYAAIDPDDVTLTNSDDDGVDVIFTQSSGSTEVSEDGVIDSYSVVLNTQPLDDVVITAVPGTGVNVTPSTLTFTAANWNNAQSFAVSAVDDDIAEGDHSASITHTASSTGDVDYDGLTVSNVSVDITDNDAASIIVTPQSGLLVSENGTTDTFTVLLGSEPTGNVTIPISSSVLSDATVSPASLVFTNANWNTPQVVTVTGVDDGAVNDGDVPFTIVTGTASSSDNSYDAVNPADVTGVNQDNDQAAVLITVNDNLLDESNAGNTASYDVVLSVDPLDTVTVTISTDADSSYAGASLTFNSGNYTTPQTVTISVVDDQIAEGTHASTISHGVSAASGPYNGISANDVVIGIADDDTVGVLVTPTTGLETNEINSSPDTFDVVLQSQPLSDVTIALASSDTDQANVSTNLLTFTAANWSTPQTVTVTGADGNNADDGDVVFTIVTGDTVCADSNYNGVSVADVSGTNRAVNNEPTLAAIANQSATEDDPPQVVVLTGISDGQSGESQSLTITATSSNPTVVPDPVVVDNNDGTAQLTYTPAANQFDPAVTITVTVVDSGSNTAPSDNTISRSFDINVASENDLPDINVASIIYNSENVALVASTGATNAINNTALNSTDVEDVDSTLTYTLVLKPGQGNVRNTNTAANISPGGTWTQDDIDQGYIVYVHDGLPGGVTDGFAFTVTDSQGGESAEVFQIYVDREAPSITLDSSDLTYNENDGALAIDSGAVVTAGDIEPFNNGYLLVEWAAGSTANDNIVVSGSATVDGSGNVSLPGPVTIGTIDSIQNGVGGNPLLINFVSTTPTAANVLTLARSIAYQNDSDDPSTALRTVQMTLNDGFLSSGTITRNILMQAINDAPVIGAASFGTILNVDLTANLPVSDVDGTIQSISVTAAPSLGSVTITDAATGAFLYQPTPNLSGSDTFDILVTDDLGATTSGTVNVHITDVNNVHPRVTSDPPMFALDGDLLVYTPVVDPTTYSGNLTFQLIDKPAGFSDPNIFGTISWDLTGHGGEVLRFSYLILDDGTNEVGIQPVLIHVLPAPGGGS